MIKAGVYRSLNFNQTIFCFEISPPDYIKTWLEDSEGNVDHWFDMDITPQKFHWLVDEWNSGQIAKVYPHWWEKVDTRKNHINSLLQLNHEELTEVFNYIAAVLPHYRWTTEVHFNSDLRPLWYQGQILRFENISREKAELHNEKARQQKSRWNAKLYGLTDDEYVAREKEGYGI